MRLSVLGSRFLAGLNSFISFSFTQFLLSFPTFYGADFDTRPFFNSHLNLSTPTLGESVSVLCFPPIDV